MYNLSGTPISFYSYLLLHTHILVHPLNIHFWLCLLFPFGYLKPILKYPIYFSASQYPLPAADNPFKPLQSQVRGCGNQMTGDGVHQHEGYNYCNHCHSTHFGSQVRFHSSKLLGSTKKVLLVFNTFFQFYGVPPGAETIEEQALREASSNPTFFGNLTFSQT